MDTSKIVGEKIKSLRESQSISIEPVSYTHLDVYKRQMPYCTPHSNQQRFLLPPGDD